MYEQYASKTITGIIKLKFLESFTVDLVELF